MKLTKKFASLLMEGLYVFFFLFGVAQAASMAPHLTSGQKNNMLALEGNITALNPDDRDYNLSLIGDGFLIFLMKLGFVVCFFKSLTLKSFLCL